MAKIVMKFGGTSVADTDRILHVAKLVKKKFDENNKVIVIVSAMAGVTNDLVQKSKKYQKISPQMNMMLCYLQESKLHQLYYLQHYKI